MEKVFLGLGSNLEDREYHLFKALGQIASLTKELPVLSSIYSTEPWGRDELKPFLNMVCAINTGASPSDLLQKIESIEKSSGRIRKEGRYLDREIDIDVLFFGSQIIRSPRLIIPHPGIEKRNFVLVPLCEIAPDFFHPMAKLSIAGLLKKSSDSLKVFKYMERDEVRRKFDQLFSEYSVN